jgi:hypothetical protein
LTRSIASSSKEEVKVRKALADAPKKVGTLSGAQAAKARTTQGKLSIRRELLSESSTRADKEPFLSFVPDRVRQASKLALAAADRALAALQLAEGEEWSGNIDEVVEEASQACDSATLFAKRLNMYLEVGDEMEPQKPKEKPEDGAVEAPDGVEKEAEADGDKPKSKRVRISSKTGAKID